MRRPIYSPFSLREEDPQDRVESRVRYVDHVHETGVRLFELACERDLEGIAAKYARGVYQTSHAITSWLKIKNATYSQAEGRAELFEQRRSPESRPRQRLAAPTFTLR